MKSFRHPLSTGTYIFYVLINVEIFLIMTCPFSIDQATSDLYSDAEDDQNSNKISSYKDRFVAQFRGGVGSAFMIKTLKKESVLLITTSLVNCMLGVRLLKWRRNFNLAGYETKPQNYCVQNALATCHI
jgi:hypothetical protein